MWTLDLHAPGHPARSTPALLPVAAAAEAASLWPIIGSVVVALLALAGAVFTATSALRSSNANNLTQIAKYANDRDQVHDKRIEDENTRLRGENDQLRARDLLRDDRLRELQELHARLRLGVIARGMDPDEITPPRPTPPLT